MLKFVSFCFNVSGNILFCDSQLQVEDQCRQLEKQLTSLQAEHKSLEKEHAIAQEKLENLQLAS